MGVGGRIDVNAGVETPLHEILDRLFDGHCEAAALSAGP